MTSDMTSEVYIRERTVTWWELCAQGLEREGVGVLRRGASKDASLSTIVVATIVSTFLLRRRTRTLLSSYSFTVPGSKVVVEPGGRVG